MINANINYSNRMVCVSAVLAVQLLCSSWVESADVYNVGVAVVDITPDYPIRLNGFGNRREESEGVSQQIYARALAISQGDQPPLVLVTLDSLGIRTPMVEQVAKRLQKSHKLPRANLAVTFSHSHCTPKVNGACDNIFSTAIPADHQQHIDQYTTELTDYITKVAADAIESRRPGQLEWSVGKVGFAKNRRLVGGPVDHDLPMLVVRDPASKKPRAIYVSYACHCVTLSLNKISGDWAGYAAAMIERRFPDAVALVSIGAGSDQNPISGVTGDKTEVAETQGVEIATEVERLLAGKLRSISGRPASVLNQITLPLKNLPTREELVEQTGKGRPTDRYNAVTQLARLDRGEKLLSEIDYPIQTWSFGDSFCMNFLAGEVCVDYALRLKAEIDRERFWLNTYSNDFCCYIPSERLLTEGGYGGGAEVPYFALPTTLRAGLEQSIIDEVHRQVPDTFLVPQGTQGVAPKSPEESLKCMQTNDNLEIRLVAAEPQVTDPVAIDFGPDGRLWVAEMNDYGRDMYEEFEQTSRIRWLRDADSDGYFEESKVFLDGLRFPTDVKVWRDGVLICDAPDILFARDEDGDGTADVTQKLFSGFEVRNAQARVNSLRLGLDNYVYGACGLFGGMITSHQIGKVVNCSNRDFRMNPDTGFIEPVSGRTQQGRCRNDWGDWFGCSNGTLLQSIPSDDRYAARNPFAAPAALPVVMTDAEAYKLYPPENLVTFELSGAPGRATSACGLGIYRDTALGHEYTNDTFTCEPVHQSVHRIDMTAGTHGFTGQRGVDEESREFLSSTDRWFRPVQVRTGPDGALWVVDMYRYVIEHSRWIPQSTLGELDVFAGKRHGRIYRILPRKSTPSESTAAAAKPVIPVLDDLSDTALLAKLNTPNGTVRDLVQQMLLWRSNANVKRSQEDNAVAARRVSMIATGVRELVASAENPAVKIQALSVLDGLGELQPVDVAAALQSKNPEVLRYAVQAGETFLDESVSLRAAVLKLASHPIIKVRRQVALSIGNADAASVAESIAGLLGNVETDKYVRSAALNSVNTKNVSEVMNAFLRLPAGDQNLGAYQQLVLLAINLGDSATIAQTIQSHLPVIDPLPTGASAISWVAALNALDARSTRDSVAAGPDVSKRIQGLLSNALSVLSAAGRSDAKYAAAMKFLGRRFGAFTQSALQDEKLSSNLSAQNRLAAIATIASPRYAASLQRGAVEALSSTAAPGANEILVERYGAMNPEVRGVIIDLLLSQAQGPLVLLKAVEAGTIRANVLDAAKRSKLLSSADAKVKEAAERILESSASSNRTTVVAAFDGSLKKTGDVVAGRTVFRKRCAACHRLEENGFVVGPDLRALTNRDPSWLLTTILDPNKDVDARYFSWTALTQDGRTVSGMLVEETAAEIRLREAGGKEHRIPRQNLEEFRSSEMSVMPEGLERDMSVQDFSDVIAYLVSFESPEKKLPGNKPQIITPDDDGVLRLTASTAEIRGGEITFETEFANIGCWHHQNDSATWKVNLPQSGPYDIYIDAACATAAAGNRFRIHGLSESLTESVVSTGGWDRYRQKLLGTSMLNAGVNVVSMRPADPVKQALIDLRELRLVPSGKPPKFAAADLNDTPLPRSPPEIAPFLLDESQPVERRQKVIDQRPGMGPGIIGTLAAGIRSGDLADEYRHIPWLWRVAIAVGKRNDGGEIRDVLETSVPADGQPLRDWQAVVLGGGLINGAAELGFWPEHRVVEILDGLPAVKARWPRTLQLAAEMADDKNVRAGTRYDALRMVALMDEDVAIPHLLRYLTRDADHQLQMGAVSGLADIPSTAVITPLAQSLSWLKGRSRFLAIEGLLRTDARAAALAKLMENGTLKLDATERQALTDHSVKHIHERALGLLTK